MFESFTWGTAWQVVQSLALAALFVYSRNQKQHQATAAEIKNLAMAMNALAEGLKQHAAQLETRIKVLETRMDSVPTHNELADIYDKLNEVRVGVGKLEGIVPGLNNMVGLMTTHLLESRKVA